MRHSTRRQFLAVAGAAALAGCTDAVTPGPSDGGRSDGATTATTGTPTGTADGTATETDRRPGAGPVDYGTVVSDFEDLSRWGTVGGSQLADAETVYAGSQSVRVEAGTGTDVAGIYRAFPDGLDLSASDLSAAVRLERPASGSIRKVTAVALAPGYSDRVEMVRYLPDTLDEWVRVDFGVTGEAGNPAMADVQELRIEVLTGGGEQIRFWVDDLRTVPKPDQGYAIFQFDNTLASHYENAFPVMEEKGYPAVEGVIPGVVNSEGRLSNGQLLELRDAGWDVASQPQRAEPLPTYSTEAQRQTIRRAHENLSIKGFEDGARHMVAPYHQLSGETVEIAAQYHDSVFLFGACPTPVAATGNHALSRVNGDSREGLRRLAPLANRYDQAVAMYFPGVERGGDMDPAELREVVGIVENAGLEPISATEFVAKMNELRSD